MEDLVLLTRRYVVHELCIFLAKTSSHVLVVVLRCRNILIVDDRMPLIYRVFRVEHHCGEVFGVGEEGNQDTPTSQIGDNRHL